MAKPDCRQTGVWPNVNHTQARWYATSSLATSAADGVPRHVVISRHGTHVVISCCFPPDLMVRRSLLNVVVPDCLRLFASCLGKECRLVEVYGQSAFTYRGATPRSRQPFGQAGCFLQFHQKDLLS